MPLITRLILAIGLLASPAVSAEKLHGKVIAVADGDTLTILVGHQPVKIRLWGIDAPEKDQAYGTRSKQNLATLVFGRDVEVDVRAQDRYGRQVGWVLIGRKPANLAQVEAGYAWWFQKYAPTATDLQAAQAEARRRRIGLWSDATAVAPWEFRRAKRTRD